MGTDREPSPTSPPTSASELTLACRATGGRLGLIRRPGEHADPRTGPRLCYLAWSGPQAFLLVGRVETPEDLLRFPFAAWPWVTARR